MTNETKSRDVVHDEPEQHTIGGTVVASPEGWWIVTPSVYHEGTRPLETTIGTERTVSIDRAAVVPVCLWLVKSDGEMVPMVPSNDGAYLVLHDQKELPLARIVHSISGPSGAKKAARSFYPMWAETILAELNEGKSE